MRIYKKGTSQELEQVRCNCCGREMKVENGILKEGCFHGDAVFGYFSTWDGVKKQFDMCESCYEGMTAGFQIPVTEEAQNELL